MTDRASILALKGEDLCHAFKDPRDLFIDHGAKSVLNSLHSGRKRLSRFANTPLGSQFQWFDGSCLVKVDDVGKLIGKARIEIVTSKLRLRTIDDTNRPLEPGLSQSSGNVAVGRQGERKCRYPDVVK